jgi:predicted phage-related endonuclease
LDGRLTDTRTGFSGVLEVKTTNIKNSMAREKWNKRVPPNYYIQILHQLLATGWNFAVLKAQMRYDFAERKEDVAGVQHISRHYFWAREEVADDLEFLLQEEIRFWGYVTRNERPPLVLPEI